MAVVGVLEDKGSVLRKKKRRRICENKILDVNDKVEVMWLMPILVLNDFPSIICFFLVGFFSFFRGGFKSWVVISVVSH